MLTTAEVRKLLGKCCPPSDAEVERLRDEAHAFIDVFLDHYIENSSKSNEKTTPD